MTKKKKVIQESVESQNGFRTGISKQDIMKLSDSEKLRIEEIRKIGMVEPGSVSYDLLRTNDSLRIQKRRAERVISLNMAAIYENFNLLSHAKLKIDDKKLWDKDDNEFKLKANVRKYHTSILTLIDNLLIAFSELIGVVDHKDVVGNVIINKKDFEVLLDETNMEIKGLGYTLLE